MSKRESDEQTCTIYFINKLLKSDKNNKLLKRDNVLQFVKRKRSADCGLYKEAPLKSCKLVTIAPVEDDVMVLF